MENQTGIELLLSLLRCHVFGCDGCGTGLNFSSLDHGKETALRTNRSFYEGRIDGDGSKGKFDFTDDRRTKAIRCPSDRVFRENCKCVPKRGLIFCVDTDRRSTAARSWKRRCHRNETGDS